MRYLTAILSAALLVSCSSGAYKAADTDTLVDSYTLDSAAIVAYDQEDSAPFQGIPISTCRLPVITKSNDTVTLASILEPGVLVARYSQHACGSCIEFTNANLMALKDSIPGQQIAVIVKDASPRDLHVFYHKFGKRFDFYYADSIPGDFDEAHTPYLFFMDGQGRVSRHFIPRKELPGMTRQYLFNSL